MQLTYKEQTYDIGELDLDRLTFEEVEKFEKVLGTPWRKIRQMITDGSSLPDRPLVWLLLKREVPELRFDDLKDVAVAALEYTPEELATIKAAAEKAAGAGKGKRKPSPSDTPATDI